MESDYTNAMLYELFIRKAHGYTRAQLINGADASVMSNLIKAEAGEKPALRLGSFNAQLKTVKGYLDKAMMKYRSRIIDVPKKKALSEIREKFGAVGSTQEIFDLIRQAKEILD